MLGLQLLVSGSLRTTDVLEVSLSSSTTDLNMIIKFLGHYSSLGEVIATHAHEILEMKTPETRDIFTTSQEVFFLSIVFFAHKW